MSNRVRVAVVGTGWWATYAHIPGLLQHQSAKLVALCDRDRAKAEMTAVAFGIDKAYDDVGVMLAHEHLDAVIVATNHASHYRVAKPCLEHGLHVLIEKPMTLNAAEAKELVTLATAHQCEISIGYNANYSSYAQRAREVLKSEILGPVQYVSGIFNQHVIDLLRGKEVMDPSFEDKVHSPGTVYSDPLLSGGGHGHLQITHLAGMLFYLTGLRAYSVSARMSNHGLNVDLVDAMMIEFTSGALAVIGGTGNMPGGRKNDLQIYCQDGWIDIDAVAGAAAIHGEKSTTEHVSESDDPTREDVRFFSTINLIDRILGQAENVASGEVGWRVVEVLDAAYRSAQQGGQPIMVEALYPLE